MINTIYQSWRVLKGKRTIALSLLLLFSSRFSSHPSSSFYLFYPCLVSLFSGSSSSFYTPSSSSYYYYHYYYYYYYDTEIAFLQIFQSICSLYNSCEYMFAMKQILKQPVINGFPKLMTVATRSMITHRRLIYC